MKSQCYVALLLGYIIISMPMARAAIVTVNFDSGSYDIRKANGTTLLTAGTAADGDGSVIQLGYFSAGTSATPFAGTWTPLTGKGGPNSAFANTSIGDTAGNANGAGTFAISITFDPAITGKNANLPATAGIPLGIRVYDNTATASGNYITISGAAASWQWKLPADAPNNPVIALSLDDNQLRLENGTTAGATVPASPLANTFATTQAVPEPSALLLQSFAALSALCFRSRNRRRF